MAYVQILWFSRLTKPVLICTANLCENVGRAWDAMYGAAVGRLGRCGALVPRRTRKDIPIALMGRSPYPTARTSKKFGQHRWDTEHLVEGAILILVPAIITASIRGHVSPIMSCLPGRIKLMGFQPTMRNAMLAVDSN